MTKSKARTLQNSTRLEVIERAIADLKLDPHNPRKHKRGQIRQIADSIEAFGFSFPVLLGPELTVIAGHGRIAACKLLGWRTIPTISRSDLTPHQAQALLLADNRLNDISSWDEALLVQNLKELAAADLSFSIEATGFDMGDIDWRITGVDPDLDESDGADLVPKLQSLAITKLGDLWELGSHRLLCGDALNLANIDNLLGGSQARMVFMDPPFNVPIHGHASGLGAHRHREFAMAAGEMSHTEYTGFLTQSLIMASTHLVDGGIAFTCIDWRHVADVVAAVERAGGDLKNICVWVKHNPGMGSLYRSGHELVVVSKHGNEPHVNNVELGRHGRHRSNVWRHPGANSLTARRGKEGDLLALHPTPKPVALVADAILDCSNRKDIVLDLFAGCGTTLIAAERTGRLAFGMELDPLYVDIAIRRFQSLTNQKVRHLITGDVFDDRARDSSSACDP